MRSPTPSAERPRAKPSLLGIFWLGIQVVWGALLGVSLQARSSELNAGHALAAYGTLAALGAAAAAVTQIAIGILSDRRRAGGSRRIEFYAIGAIAGAASIVWFYLAPSFAQLIAAVLCLQIAMNVAIGPYQAAIPDFVEERSIGTASSWMAALQSAGNAIGAVMAGLIRDARVLAAGIAVILVASAVATSVHAARLQPNTVPLVRLRFTRAFADLFVSRALVYVGFYTLLGYLYFYMARTLGGDVKISTSVVLLIFTAAGAAGAALGAAPANRADRRAVASAGGAAFIAALIAFLFSHSFAAIAIGAAVAGAAWGVFLTADWALGCDLLPKFALATAMGVWNLALLLPQIAAPAIATAAIGALHALQRPQAPRIAFVVAAIEVACGLTWLWRLPAKRRSV